MHMNLANLAKCFGVGVLLASVGSFMPTTAKAQPLVPVAAGTEFNGWLGNGVDFTAKYSEGRVIVSVDVSPLQLDSEQLCYVQGHAQFDFASTRVHISTNRLTCVNQDSRKVVDVPLKGYVVGKDKIKGVAGEPLENGSAIRIKPNEPVKVVVLETVAIRFQDLDGLPSKSMDAKAQ